MGVAFLRKKQGAATLFGALVASVLPSSVLAQPLGKTIAGPDSLQNLMLETAPLAIGAGALGFAIIAAFWVVRTRREIVSKQQQSQHQIALMRAKLDEYEALLSTTGEVTILWAPGARPKIFGEMEAIFPDGGSVSGLLNFSAWITPDDAKKLKACLARLNSGGQSFAENLVAIDGSALSATGRTIGGATSLRLRVAGKNRQENKAATLLNIAAGNEGTAKKSVKGRQTVCRRRD